MRTALARHFVRAAKQLDSAEVFDGCCHAFITTCGCAEGVTCTYWEAEEAFKDFTPRRDPPGGYWFGPRGTNREVRVLALLFAAEIAN